MGIERVKDTPGVSPCKTICIYGSPEGLCSLLCEENATEIIKECLLTGTHFQFVSRDVVLEKDPEFLKKLDDCISGGEGSLRPELQELKDFRKEYVEKPTGSIILNERQAKIVDAINSSYEEVKNSRGILGLIDNLLNIGNMKGYPLVCLKALKKDILNGDKLTSLESQRGMQALIYAVTEVTNGK